jgi:predicted NAD-dependent protein-ADP-ribosyltransferase YbiA (DUF1768 family)
MSTIKIFNPHDKPYGRLCNNYRHPLSIDDTLWQSVSSYVFSNMLTGGLNRTILKNARANKAQQFYVESVNEEYIRDVKEAIDDAVAAKVKHPGIAQLLMSTGKSPLYYVSQDTNMGVEEDGIKGNNLYGIALMKVRYDLCVNARKQAQADKDLSKSDNIYHTYLALEFLKDKLRDGNDLSDYENMTLSEIIELSPKNISKDAIVQMYERGQLEELNLVLNDHDMLVALAKRDGSRKLMESATLKNEFTIFEMYVDSILKKQYPDLPEKDYAAARQQHFAELNDKSLRKRVNDLYKLEVLPQELLDDINGKIVGLYIPTIDEVNEAEAVVFEPSAEQEKDASICDVLVHAAPVGDPIFIREDDDEAIYTSLKPMYDGNPLLVSTAIGRAPAGLERNESRRMFPTVSHYIVSFLIGKIRVKKGVKEEFTRKLGIDKGRAAIMIDDRFMDIVQATNVYAQMKPQETLAMYQFFLNKGLRSKFRNNLLKALLLATVGKRIKYTDRSNSILGMGADGRGMNLVGENLMMIRDELAAQQEDVRLSKRLMSNVIFSNPVIIDWVEMRVRDICTTTTILYRYLGDTDVPMTARFVSLVLDTVYGACNSLPAVRVEKAPEFFERLIHDCAMFGFGAGPKNNSDEIAPVVWKRVVEMLNALMAQTDVVDPASVAKMIVEIQSTVSKRTVCKNGDDCTVSALINLVRSINNLKHELDGVGSVVCEDFQVAAQILRNRVKKTKPSEDAAVAEQLFDKGEDEVGDKVGDEVGDKVGDEEVAAWGDQYVDDEDEDEFDYGEEVEFGFDNPSEEFTALLWGLERDLSQDYDLGFSFDTGKIAKCLSQIKVELKQSRVSTTRINFFASV